MLIVERKRIQVNEELKGKKGYRRGRREIGPFHGGANSNIVGSSGSEELYGVGASPWDARAK